MGGGSERKTPWDIRFAFGELEQYKAKHGDCNVPRRQEKPGTWVHDQRSRYERGELSQDRIDRLENIGFHWAPQKSEWEGLWNTRFSELERYKAEHGDCNVSSRSGGTLGNWVSSTEH